MAPASQLELSRRESRRASFWPERWIAPLAVLFTLPFSLFFALLSHYACYPARDGFMPLLVGRAMSGPRRDVCDAVIAGPNLIVVAAIPLLAAAGVALLGRRRGVDSVGMAVLGGIGVAFLLYAAILALPFEPYPEPGFDFD